MFGLREDADRTLSRDSWCSITFVISWFSLSAGTFEEEKASQLVALLKRGAGSLFSKRVRSEERVRPGREARLLMIRPMVLHRSKGLRSSSYII